ncbi:MAG: hypothetical protein M1820_007041 [Bogoriella megaspora]|nr:MAG: hypothetical protein M1820_007041 [Bogoriella megaspora]
MPGIENDDDDSDDGKDKRRIKTEEASQNLEPIDQQDTPPSNAGNDRSICSASIDRNSVQSSVDRTSQNLAAAEDTRPTSGRSNDPSSPLGETTSIPLDMHNSDSHGHGHESADMRKSPEQLTHEQDNEDGSHPADRNSPPGMLSYTYQSTESNQVLQAGGDDDEKQGTRREVVSEPNESESSLSDMGPPGRYDTACLDAEIESEAWKALEKHLNNGWLSNLNLKRLPFVPALSLTEYPKFISRRSRTQGQVDWSPDPHNASLITSLFSYWKIQSMAPDNAWRLWAQGLLALQGNVWILDAEQLLCVRNTGLVGRLPDVSVDDLMGRSRRDLMAKLLALWQIITLIADLIQRAAENLPTSPLEIATLSFAVIALLIYILLWNQPCGASAPIHITASRRPTAADLDELAWMSRESIVSRYTHEVRTLKIGSLPPLKLGRFSLPRSRAILHGPSNVWSMISVVICTMTFGAVHMISWDFAFPTRIEKLLWRIAILMNIGIPACHVVAVSVCIVIETPQIKNKVLNRWLHGRSMGSFMFNGFTAPVILLGAGAYVIARLYILVEVFRASCFLPPGAYVATGSSNIPQFS